MIGPINQTNWLTFSGDSLQRIRIPDHFSTSLTIAEVILRDLLAFLIQSPVILRHSAND